ncbi:MAG: hypothetical protein Q4F88_04645 [Eubacteriales bacterium]|nr:hypothetical protein [Eubacteriales bacterium]
MKKIRVQFLLFSIVFLVGLGFNSYALTTVIRGKTIKNIEELIRMQPEKFTATTATKSGDTYKNAWSNYYITCVGGRQAYDYYDFSDADSKYDFGLEFSDGSRLAIYYTTLSRDLQTVATSFAEGKGVITDRVLGGLPYKHIALVEPNPYGVDIHEFYLRDLGGKLMVVDCFYTNATDLSPYCLLTMAPLVIQ